MIFFYPYATSDTAWALTPSDDMNAFIGMNIAMGFHKLTDFRDYWSNDPLLQVPYISNIMPRARYQKLCQYMHVSDPRIVNVNDKIHKVRNLVTKLTERFQTAFKPGKQLSIDEAMIQFDGRLAWKQYMPKKPVSWGIKLWCLCDSTTGYCLNFSVYTGGDMNQAHSEVPAHNTKKFKASTG